MFIQRFRSELFENILETCFRLICLNQLKGQAPGNIPVPPEVETRAVVDGVVVWKVRGK